MAPIGSPWFKSDFLSGIASGISASSPRRHESASNLLKKEEAERTICMDSAAFCAEPHTQVQTFLLHLDKSGATIPENALEHRPGLIEASHEHGIRNHVDKDSKLRTTESSERSALAMTQMQFSTTSTLYNNPK